MNRTLLFLALLSAPLLAWAAPQPIVILQVEETRDNTFTPDRATIPGSVKLTLDPLTSLFPGASVHATAVAQRLLSHPEYIAELQVQHQGTYWGRVGIGIGRASYSGTTEIYPRPAGTWLVSNHSYGVMYPFGMDEALLKLDRRAERDNEVIVVAIPDSGTGWVELFGMPAPRKIASCAHNIITVGSARGYHEVLPGSRVDIVTDEDWTSYGAPKVAETAAAMISETLGAGKTYHWNEVRNAILDSADPMPDTATFGHGRLNREAALKLWRNRKELPGAAIVPAPVPPVVVRTPTPPIITSFTGPSGTITRNESKTLSWTTTGASSVMLRDFSVATVGSYTPLVYQIGENSYTLSASNADGSVSQTLSFTVRDYTDDEKRGQAAAVAGATYDAGTGCFNGVRSDSIAKLVSELSARGL